MYECRRLSTDRVQARNGVTTEATDMELREVGALYPTIVIQGEGSDAEEQVFEYEQDSDLDNDEWEGSSDN